MVNASPSQVKLLEELRGQVLDAMHSIEKVRSMRLSTLATIKLGVLRKNATQRHGVTRWQRSHAGELTVETVDLHPHLLCEGWEDYAAFVLYHEFLHALGFRAHDQRFRVLEAMWPHGGSERGKAFTNAMRSARATWMWKCPSCQQTFPRQRPGRGRFVCRPCRAVLLDVPITNAE